MNTRNSLLIATAVLASACTGNGSDAVDPGPPGPTSSLSTIDTSINKDGIVPLPATVDARITAVLDRYAEITAPNGRRIHFLSQGSVSDALLFRARALVRQHFDDVAGSSLGADKTSVFNSMADGNATFVLVESSTSFDPIDVDVLTFMDFFDGLVYQLDASTIVQEGSAAYMQPQPEIDMGLDASAKFALRFGLSRALPQFQDDLTAATANALTNDLFRPAAGVPSEDLDDEYLGLALSVYYGIWGHDPNGNGTAGPNGEYDFSDRAAMVAGDPQMIAVIESFFSPTEAFPAYLVDFFSGTFEMTFDPLIAYTHRSRYLERAGLRGMLNARINGNELDNVFLGGYFADSFEGRGGNDILEANEGNDAAYFSGNLADYTIIAVDDTVTRVTDNVANRDGVDELRGIVQIHFADQTINL